jgi:hypothetical protein
MFGRQGRVRMVPAGAAPKRSQLRVSGTNELVFAVLAIVVAAALAVPLVDLMSRI